jgi:hypothetical protein
MGLRLALCTALLAGGAFGCTDDESSRECVRSSGGAEVCLARTDGGARIEAQHLQPGSQFEGVLDAGG